MITSVPPEGPAVAVEAEAGGESVPAPLGDELRDAVERIRGVGEFTAAELAEILESQVTSVRSWLSHQRRPSKTHARRILAVDDLLERLQYVVPAETVSSWIRRPIRYLEGAAALDALQRDDLSAFDALVTSLEYPGAT